MPTGNVRIHPTAEVSPDAHIGEGTQIWHQAQVREGASIGESCVIGKGVYVDHDVSIGSNVKLQNGAFIYHGASLEDGVFIGPNACLTNDKYPRAITPQGQVKGTDDWEVGPILVKHGASVGAGAVVLPDVTIGVFALVGAGAVVTADVPDYGIVVGNPARLKGFACKCARRLEVVGIADPAKPSDLGDPRCVTMRCRTCGESYEIPQKDFDRIR
ncbi:MAG: N-acetyltransferase [Chloroflexi bacterium]|nr:N-acetyltransferase [Chloroflexota bacterium]